MTTPFNLASFADKVSSTGTANPSAISDVENTSTGALGFPVGTTAQRNGTPVTGMTRINSTSNALEIYYNGSWVDIFSFEVSQTAFIGSSLTPFFSAFEWSASSGFGVKYSNGTETLNQIRSLKVNNDKNVVLIGFGLSPYVAAYAWSSAGLGAKFANPSNPPIRRSYVAFNPSNTVVGIGSSGSGAKYSAYAWSSAGWGAKYADSLTVNDNAQNVTFSPSGDAISFVTDGPLQSQYLETLAWNDSTGFGAKYADPSPLIAGLPEAVSFSPSGNVIAVANAGTPPITVYPWSAATGYGAKYADIATTPTATCYAVDFSKDGNTLGATGAGNARFYYFYPWSSATGFGARYSFPSPLVAATVYSYAFDKTDQAIISGNTGSVVPPANVVAYAWSPATGFGAKYADPSFMAAGTIYAVAVS